MLGIALAGCTGRDGGQSPTPTRRPTATRTLAQGLGTIEYTVTNADDVAHRLDVAMENAEGGWSKRRTSRRSRRAPP